MAIDFEQALVTKLTGTAAISAIVSSRVHPLRLPDTATLPAIVYTEISAPIVQAHDSTYSNALTYARYQIDAWASSYGNAIGLAAAIFVALEGFHGVVTSGTDTLLIQSCLRKEKRTNHDTDTMLTWVSQDFVFWY